jgi:hypothetical protein
VQHTIHRHLPSPYWINQATTLPIPDAESQQTIFHVGELTFDRQSVDASLSKQQDHPPLDPVALILRYLQLRCPFFYFIQ